MIRQLQTTPINFYRSSLKNSQLEIIDPPCTCTIESIHSRTRETVQTQDECTHPHEPSANDIRRGKPAHRLLHYALVMITK